MLSIDIKLILYFFLLVIGLIFLIFPFLKQNKKKIGNYEKYTFSKGRKIVVEGLNISSKQHYVHSYIEIDVTKARKKINKFKTDTKIDISFTGWLIKCIAQSVTKHKIMHARRAGFKKIIIFDDVDVAYAINRSLKGELIPFIHIIKKANEKSLREITREMRSVQSKKVNDNDLIDHLETEYKLANLALKLPGIFTKIAWRVALRNPFIMKRVIGTVMVSTVGGFGKFQGWATPMGAQTLIFAINGINRKYREIGEKAEFREILNLTISFNHDIVDGAPFANFLNDLTNILEKAENLDLF